MNRILMVLLATLVLFAVLGESAGRCDKPVPTRVTYDEHNRVLLNGKLWFPIIFTPKPPPLGAKDPRGRDAVEVLAAGGVDCYRIGRGLITREEQDECARYLDWFAKHGVYGMPYVSEPTVFDPKSPNRKEMLRTIVERFRHHPALAIWKTMDEPAWGRASVEGMQDAYRYLKRIDPDHPAWMAHAPRNTLASLREYCKACDMTGLDIYPISIPMGKHGHFPNKEISVVGDYAQWLNKAVDGKKPFFMILQVCWSGVTPPNHILVMPTFRQERFMTYQAIVNGARGLVYFGMPVALQGRDAELGYNWTFWDEVLRPLLREIGKGSELHAALLAPESKIPLKVTGQPEVEYCVREAGPFVYIMAVKREGPEREVRFSGDLLKGDVQVMFEDRTIEARDGAFTDTFGPFDVHVYRMRKP